MLSVAAFRTVISWLSCSAQQGQLGSAINEFRAAIRLKPDYAEAHYALGLALKRQGKPELAKEALRAAEKLDPRLKAKPY